MIDRMKTLRNIFGDRLMENKPLARYSSARVGGVAAGIIIVKSTRELVEVIEQLQKSSQIYRLIGEGSNILFGDSGFDGVIVINQTKSISFDATSNPPTIKADSGVNLATLSRKAAEHGLSGLEWACSIPGTVGGAVYGNAGAHGSEISKILTSADILQPDGNIQTWDCARFAYGYRTSCLKSESCRSIVLSATFQMQTLDVIAIKNQMAEFTAKRKSSQPTGASLGSIFKNPEGDHAGRLIDEAGLKGTRIGGAEISTKHANFILNHGQANALDIYQLINMVKEEVYAKFGVKLETEIELIGNFSLE